MERFLGARPGDDADYLVYLLVIATLGWALASYDFNLLVVALPTIAKDLSMSQTQVGAVAFFVYAAMLVLSLLVGWSMDRFGRKIMWQVALVGAAICTGLTFFVQGFWALVVVRALASGLANSELAISITLVNEELRAERRGFLYSIVQGGWPLGVLLASAVFLALNGGLGLDWHVVFLFGVIPLAMVIVGRRWVRPSERFQTVKAIEKAKEAGDEARVDELRERYDVNADELGQVTVKQIFSEGGWVRSQLLRLHRGLDPVLRGLRRHERLHSRLVDSVPVLLRRRGDRAAPGRVGDRLRLLCARRPARRALRPPAVPIVSAALAAALTIAFYFASAVWLVWVIYLLVYQVTNGTWPGTGYAYWAESFPTRVRGTAVGWLGAMFTGGLIIGSAVWTALIGSLGAVTLLIIGGGFAVLQFAATFLLPHIPPGQELEDITT